MQASNNTINHIATHLRFIGKLIELAYAPNAPILFKNTLNGYVELLEEIARPQPATSLKNKITPLLSKLQSLKMLESLQDQDLSLIETGISDSLQALKQALEDSETTNLDNFIHTIKIAIENKTPPAIDLVPDQFKNNDKHRSISGMTIKELTSANKNSSAYSASQEQEEEIHKKNAVQARTKALTLTSAAIKQFNDENYFAAVNSCNQAVLILDSIPSQFRIGHDNFMRDDILRQIAKVLKTTGRAINSTKADDASSLNQRSINLFQRSLAAINNLRVKKLDDLIMSAELHKDIANTHYLSAQYTEAIAEFDTALLILDNNSIPQSSNNESDIITKHCQFWTIEAHLELAKMTRSSHQFVDAINHYNAALTVYESLYPDKTINLFAAMQYPVICYQHAVVEMEAIQHSQNNVTADAYNTVIEMCASILNFLNSDILLEQTRKAKVANLVSVLLATALSKRSERFYHAQEFDLGQQDALRSLQLLTGILQITPDQNSSLDDLRDSYRQHRDILSDSSDYDSTEIEVSVKAVSLKRQQSEQDDFEIDKTQAKKLKLNNPNYILDKIKKIEKDGSDITSAAFIKAFQINQTYDDLHKKFEAKPHDMDHQERLCYLLPLLFCDINHTTSEKVALILKEFENCLPLNIVNKLKIIHLTLLHKETLNNNDKEHIRIQIIKELAAYDHTRKTGVSKIYCRINLSNAVLPGINLTNVKLNNADLVSINLGGALLENANFDAANLQQAFLTHANLNHAVLTVCDLEDANLSGAQLAFANLTGANLENADLSGAILMNAIVVDTDFTDCNLENADFTGARFFMPYIFESLVNFEPAIATFNPSVMGHKEANKILLAVIDNIIEQVMCKEIEEADEFISTALTIFEEQEKKRQSQPSADVSQVANDFTFFDNSNNNVPPHLQRLREVKQAIDAELAKRNKQNF